MKPVPFKVGRRVFRLRKVVLSPFCAGLRTYYAIADEQGRLVDTALTLSGARRLCRRLVAKENPA